MVIKQISLIHKGGAYHYRLHNQKLNELSFDYPSLIAYLNKVFEKCPDNYFFKGPRSSMLRFGLSNLNMHQIIGHEVSDLCYNGLKFNKDRYKTSHSKVQVFMLENDDKTVGVEIPIWIKKDEFNNFNGMFNSDDPLTGHIDLLRIENNKIWVWDYKPKAFDEKYAATQVFFYSLMLSKRSNIPYLSLCVDILMKSMLLFLSQN